MLLKESRSDKGNKVHTKTGKKLSKIHNHETVESRTFKSKSSINLGLGNNDASQVIRQIPKVVRQVNTNCSRSLSWLTVISIPGSFSGYWANIHSYSH